MYWPVIVCDFISLECSVSRQFVDYPTLYKQSGVSAVVTESHRELERQRDMVCECERETWRPETTSSVTFEYILVIKV